MEFGIYGTLRWKKFLMQCINFLSALNIYILILKVIISSLISLCKPVIPLHRSALLFLHSVLLLLMATNLLLRSCNGNPLQYSCLENPMGGGAWWAAVHGVAKSPTRLERLHFHFSLSCIGEGNGNPLQCSCLENPMDGGAWWAAVNVVGSHRVGHDWSDLAAAAADIETCHSGSDQQVVTVSTGYLCCKENASIFAKRNKDNIKWIVLNTLEKIIHMWNFHIYMKLEVYVQFHLLICCYLVTKSFPPLLWCHGL